MVNDDDQNTGVNGKMVEMLRNYLFAAVYDSGIYESVIFIDKQGEFLLDATDGSYERLNYLEMDFYRAATRGNRLVQDVITSPITGEPILIAGNPVYNSGNEIIGSAGIILKFDLIANKIIKSDNALFSYGIIDKGGNAIASDNLDMSLFSDAEIVEQEIYDQMKNDKVGHIFYAEDEKLVVYSVFPEKNWYLYSVIAVKDYERDIKPIKRVIYLILVFVIFIAAVVIISSARLRTINIQYAETLEILKNTQEKLIMSEKIASLGNLVSGFSHEINTPIGNCVMATSFLRSKADKLVFSLNDNTITKSELNEFLGILNGSISRMSINLDRVTNLINSFKKIDSYRTNEKKAVFNMKECIEETIVKMRVFLNMSNIDTIVICDEKINIKNYSDAISEIVGNLIKNVVNHAYLPDAKGVITITVDTVDENVVLKFADEGQGIKHEFINRIFDPFFTTKMSGENNGLGLNTVFNTVHQVIDGEIKCNSKENEGTEFVIVFPKGE